MGNFKKIFFVGASAIILSLPLSAVSAEQDQHKGTHAVHGEASGADALIEEMRKLDGVFREVVSGVAVGDGHRVHSALESMHGAMEKTQEALHKGEVKLKKNADKAAEFERMDKAFHHNLEALAKAAHHNDGQKMTAFTKKLLDGCVSCHSKFRK